MGKRKLGVGSEGKWEMGRRGSGKIIESKGR